MPGPGAHRAARGPGDTPFRLRRFRLTPPEPLPRTARTGRVAQRESTPFTREGSQVQSLSRPP
jgi:hypothetical protein